MSKKQTLLLVAVILFIDQASKIYIKTHFELGQELKIFEGFRIYFIENTFLSSRTEELDDVTHR